MASQFLKTAHFFWIRARAAGLSLLWVWAGTLLSASTPTLASDFLPVDQAFKVSAEAQTNQIRVTFVVHEGYYLYEERLHFEVVDADNSIVKTDLPNGQIHHDDYFGDQRIFKGTFSAQLHLQQSLHPNAFVKIKLQGCAEAGLCYPPKTVTIALNRSSTSAMTTSELPTSGAEASHLTTQPTSQPSPTPSSEQSRLIDVIKHGSWLTLLGSFLVLGSLLSLTPCVLPMVPIVAGLVAGAHSNSRQGFTLSLCYVFGMSLTYTAAGMLCALMGSQVQAIFQAPMVIIAFAGVMVLMALSMFGAFNLEMPSLVQTQLSVMSQKLAGGGYFKTILIGALSALIVSACVAPPLVAALSVIGQTGDVARGGLALGALSIGMGLPLLLVGMTAGRFMPKSGPWMLTVKAFFGVLLLAVAAWLSEKILPASWLLAAWGLVALSSAFVFLRIGGSSLLWLRFPLGVMSLALAVVWFYGFSQHNDDPWHPLATLAHGQVQFRSIRSTQELASALQSARDNQQWVMLDFTADWCASCKEMDRQVFRKPAVMAALAPLVLLRADVTDNTENDQALLKQFGLYGPPGTLFFNPQGTELSDARLIGFTDADQFLHHLNTLRGSTP